MPKLGASARVGSGYTALMDYLAEAARIARAEEASEMVELELLWEGFDGEPF